MPHCRIRPVLVAVLAACTGDATSERDTATPLGASAREAGPAVSGSTPAGGPSAAAQAPLDSAARRLVTFLRGQGPLDSRTLADTVELRLAPEGGGARVRIARAPLASPSAWEIQGRRQRYALAPPAGYGELTTAVGQHVNCQAVPLASRAPEWASRPHVGVRLQPDSARSCLQSWNATFVFDTSTVGAPRLIGVLYDQWEW